LNLNKNSNVLFKKNEFGPTEKTVLSIIIYVNI